MTQSREARVWTGAEQHTIPELLERRLQKDPDGAYLDVCGRQLTARDVWSVAQRLAIALRQLGVTSGDRVATLLDNSAEAVLSWWGVIAAGAIAVPINTAYKGAYLRHQLADSGAVVLVAQADLVERVREPEGLRHLIVVGDSDHIVPGVAGHRWDDLLAVGSEGTTDTGSPRPSDVATFVYTGGTTGPSKGCMLSHTYHVGLAEQTSLCLQRTADDVLWTPLPLYHLNALAIAVIGPLVCGGRAAIAPRFSVSSFWPEICRTGATIASTLGTMAYLLAHDVDRDGMPRSGSVAANRTLRLIAAAPMPVEVDRVIRERFGTSTFSGAYGMTEASLVSWQPPGVTNKPNAAGVVNDVYFDARIFDEDDREVPPGVQGEIVLRPKRPHAMFEGYWGRPEATVEASRNWWFHTGDIGKIDEDGFLYFVDRQADYLRRRGENISSFEVERILMSRGDLADVAVHGVPSELTEDDLKVTATVKTGSEVSEEELFRWCLDELPYFALPRYIEFCSQLPRSAVGRVLKRDLRAAGVTPATWDSEAAGIAYERR